MTPMVVRWNFNFILQESDNPLASKSSQKITELENDVLSSTGLFFGFRLASTNVIWSE